MTKSEKGIEINKQKNLYRNDSSVSVGNIKRNVGYFFYCFFAGSEMPVVSSYIYVCTVYALRIQSFLLRRIISKSNFCKPNEFFYEVYT